MIFLSISNLRFQITHFLLGLPADIQLELEQLEIEQIELEQGEVGQLEHEQGEVG